MKKTLKIFMLPSLSRLQRLGQLGTLTDENLKLLPAAASTLKSANVAMGNCSLKHFLCGPCLRQTHCDRFLLRNPIQLRPNVFARTNNVRVPNLLEVQPPTIKKNSAVCALLNRLLCLTVSENRGATATGSCERLDCKHAKGCSLRKRDCCRSLALFI